MNPANIVKINRAHRKGWTANEIARVYGFRRSEVQRVILGEHKKTPAQCKAAWRANQLLAAGCDAGVVAANFGGRV